MCRNIRTLYNFDPPATHDEIRASALQFVRKLSGFNAPSKANEAAFERAVQEIAASARVLVGSLVTSAEPRHRDVEAAKARARSIERFLRRRIHMTGRDCHCCAETDNCGNPANRNKEEPLSF